MEDNIKSLLSDIRGKLESDCENGWDRHTSKYIVDGEKSYEYRMSRGDSWAWELISKIDAALNGGRNE